MTAVDHVNILYSTQNKTYYYSVHGRPSVSSQIYLKLNNTVIIVYPQDITQVACVPAAITEWEICHFYLQCWFSVDSMTTESFIFLVVLIHYITESHTLFNLTHHHHHLEVLLHVKMLLCHFSKDILFVHGSSVRYTSVSCVITK